MDKKEVLLVYERLANLTEKMAKEAQAKNWQSFEQLESVCAREVNGVKNKPVPALEGKQRLRKVDLLKQILANDRAIRDATESAKISSRELVHH